MEKSFITSGPVLHRKAYKQTYGFLRCYVHNLKYFTLWEISLDVGEQYFYKFTVHTPKL